VRTLTSSGTGGARSVIPIDKTTAFRQVQALASTLKAHLGTRRRPFLVLDMAASNRSGDESITARGAAIRGLMPFASETCYAFTDDFRFDHERVETFLRAHRDDELLVFGFTYIIWTEVLAALAKRPLPGDCHAPRATLLHGGGWKRMFERKVDKATFSRGVATAFGMPTERVLDFYGMGETTGLVIDCTAGAKHAPSFADVIIRDPQTGGVAMPGTPGLIEIVSALPTSYPGQAILTEDVGVIDGIDDCPCGRLGKRFRFLARVEKAEIRGCGDTYTQTVRR
jgi:hypothetical protein